MFELKMPWKGPFKVDKVFNNNMVQFFILINDELKNDNVNKLKNFNLTKYVFFLAIMILVVPNYKQIIKLECMTQSKKL